MNTEYTQRGAQVRDLLIDGIIPSKIAEQLGISRQRVNQIIKRYGLQFLVYELNVSKSILNNKIKAELARLDAEKKELKTRWRAARYGATLAQYQRLERLLGPKLLSKFRTKMKAQEGNCQRVEFIEPFRYMQIGIYDYAILYVNFAIKCYPGLPLRGALAMLLSESSEWQLRRVDLGSPYMLGNLHFVSIQEFGAKVGVEYGLRSGHKSSHNKQRYTKKIK